MVNVIHDLVPVCRILVNMVEKEGREEGLTSYLIVGITGAGTSRVEPCRRGVVLHWYSG
jgi:hypothetical protein